ncbi:dienelactone hydrolase [Paenibacillus filicis]|uniref:Dienelactone hydrolase n=1 Tax=Paenibacillus gyeongsangnamensis TaxID=3388067 RepID=A0ABT4QAX5_9BACL|nr:dienelactone hydrolase [Paenibacillus filicis]MCZ8513835.1 dienelactone hydrolase [Paenibacillus filicis]
MTDCGDVIRERVEIGMCEGLRMPVYVLRPKQAAGHLPVALALHGHGYGSREIVGLSPEGEEQAEGSGIHKHFAVGLARRGCLVVAPELLGFGDRRLEEDVQAGPRQSSCPQLASYLLLMGKTLAGVRTFEAMRAIDYALAREDARPNAGVGCMGLSGGMIAALTAVLDERIQACVLSGYANTYQDSILSRKHCLDNYVPGLLELGEMADLLSLYAPRALYVESGTKDTVFPLKGSLAAAETLQAAYRALGAEDRFVHEVFEGRHEISGAHAYDWLKAQLSGAS